MHVGVGVDRRDLQQDIRGAVVAPAGSRAVHFIHLVGVLEETHPAHVARDVRGIRQLEQGLLTRPAGRLAQDEQTHHPVGVRPPYVRRVQQHALTVGGGNFPDDRLEVALVQRCGQRHDLHGAIRPCRW